MKKEFKLKDKVYLLETHKIIGNEKFIVCVYPGKAVKEATQNLKEELEGNFNDFKDKIKVYGIADVDIPEEVDTLEFKQNKAFEKNIGDLK